MPIVAYSRGVSNTYPQRHHLPFRGIRLFDFAHALSSKQLCIITCLKLFQGLPCFVAHRLPRHIHYFTSLVGRQGAANCGFEKLKTDWKVCRLSARLFGSCIGTPCRVRGRSFKCFSCVSVSQGANKWKAGCGVFCTWSAQLYFV